MIVYSAVYSPAVSVDIVKVYDCWLDTSTPLSFQHLNVYPTLSSAVKVIIVPLGICDGSTDTLLLSGLGAKLIVSVYTALYSPFVSLVSLKVYCVLSDTLLPLYSQWSNLYPAKSLAEMVTSLPFLYLPAPVSCAFSVSEFSVMVYVALQPIPNPVPNAIPATNTPAAHHTPTFLSIRFLLAFGSSDNASNFSFVSSFAIFSPYIIH